MQPQLDWLATAGEHGPLQTLRLADPVLPPYTSVTEQSQQKTPTLHRTGQALEKRVLISFPGSQAREAVLHRWSQAQVAIRATNQPKSASHGPGQAISSEPNVPYLTQ